MEPWLAGLIILGAAALCAAGMVVVRRQASQSSFRDPVPVAAVYSVVGTAYMVIVAFVFFVAFESYHNAKADAEEEATAALAMFYAAIPFGPIERARLQGQVFCYAREVIADEWPSMRDGRASPVVDARVRAMEATAAGITLVGDKQVAAYEHWFALNEDRRTGRRGRIAQASGLVPPVLWLILIVGAVVVIAGVGFFAESREPRFTQAAMMAGIVIIVVSGLLMVRFFDRPYENKSGSIKPTAMASSLAQMEAQRRQRPAHIRC
jgi:hypothetical protein